MAVCLSGAVLQLTQHPGQLHGAHTHPAPVPAAGGGLPALQLHEVAAPANTLHCPVGAHAGWLG